MVHVRRDSEGKINLVSAANYTDEFGATTEELSSNNAEVLAFLNPAIMPTLTARQLRLGLVAHGITLGRVSATLAAIPDTAARDVAQIEWEFASQFERSHPLIEQVGAALGLTPEQIDIMWLEALKL